MNHAGPFAPLLRTGIRASDAGQRATGGGLTDSVPPRSTRIDLLAGYRDRGHEVWLELGLQSANDATLARVNRGHGFAEYRTAVLQAHRRGLPVCTHLIVGLPGEGRGGPGETRAFRRTFPSSEIVKVAG
jgi:radical SAM superfamily enzyme YgiQ (UPF0313 family)